MTAHSRRVNRFRKRSSAEVEGSDTPRAPPSRRRPFRGTESLPATDSQRDASRRDPATNPSRNLPESDPPISDNRSFTAAKRDVPTMRVSHESHQSRPHKSVPSFDTPARSCAAASSLEWRSLHRAPLSEPLGPSLIVRRHRFYYNVFFAPAAQRIIACV